MNQTASLNIQAWHFKWKTMIDLKIGEDLLGSQCKVHDEYQYFNNKEYCNRGT